MSSFGLASAPICSSVFSHGSSRLCASVTAAPWAWACESPRILEPLADARSDSDPSTSYRSCCITLRNFGFFLREALRRTCTRASAARRASAATASRPAPFSCTSCTFDSTVTASFSRPRVSFMSSSSARNLSCSSLRSAVAVESASWSSAISLLRAAMVVFSSASFASPSSRSVVRRCISLVANSMAATFSFSVVVHQHIYFS
mmetsp:Transcript_39566/g.106109  ORF Transcript_39566/g.106109 Transcript_39566/m.106109 type:complete len:204 (+) Transcript_39566:553-1164(+)